eukprot:TRINITY_DN23930_c0_g1_i10.p1 TRINITY_DN23930_c0_g1~~TRINITY_DN23930_c0_g1_i10.p1  ORF type:complete len:462 (-),score=78.22 TRINITY_DN23930_c0_g1_i10:336-1721(-)
MKSIIFCFIPVSAPLVNDPLCYLLGHCTRRLKQRRAVWTTARSEFSSQKQKKSSVLNENPQAKSRNMPIDIQSNPILELMLVSDLDSTMVDHDDPSHEYLLKFIGLWNSEYSHNSCLVYSSGRSPERYKDLRRQVPLLTPHVTVLSIGTEIFYGKSMEPDSEWLRLLDQGWDRDIILKEAKSFPQLKLQEHMDQRPHKISFFLDKQDASEVQNLLFHRLQQYGLEVKFIYSSGSAFDILPKMGGKGEALSYLMKKLRNEGWHCKNILVCGDSGNDIDLFQTNGVKGVIVCNAQEELVSWYKSQDTVDHIYHASKKCAGGIVEAIEHFQLGQYISPYQRINADDFVARVNSFETSTTNGLAKREVIEFNIFMELWLSGRLPNDPQTYQRVTAVIAENATGVFPWGKELGLKESINAIREKHGLMRGKCYLTWIDNIKENNLAKGIHLVTWESWERFDGMLGD